MRKEERREGEGWTAVVGYEMRIKKLPRCNELEECICMGLEED